MSKSLEERLKTHSSAFDGLLSLIPAKYYYDEATQNQWKEKKKSKDELKLNKRAKLDPETVNVQNSSAKDILKQKLQTAKPVVLPKLNVLKPQTTEEEQGDEASPGNEDDADDDESVDFNPSELEDEAEIEEEEEKKEEDEDLLAGGLIFDDEGNEIERAEPKVKQTDLKKQSPKKQLSAEEQLEKDAKLAQLREKLASKITAMKEKRKAPGTKVAGAPSSRQQILELRKLKLEQAQKRKLALMENSDVEEDEDENDDDEDEDEKLDSVLFQNIVFEDGDRLTSDLSALRKGKGKKGPSNNDIKSHLAKLQLQKQKISEMDPEKRLAFEEKSKWNRLISNIEGVKLKDDEKLLKKSLKRKEKQKLKSEREWRERKDTVESTILAKLKRREENLQLRKENKGKKSKHQQKMKRTFTGIINKRTTPGSDKKKQKRAGFEGRLKSGRK